MALLKYDPSRMVSVDISQSLVKHVESRDQRIEVLVSDIMELDKVLLDKFDIVVSSEVIEHTPKPKNATKQLLQRVKKGGLISISCPNMRWIWLLKLANIFGIRKNYQGHENWVHPIDLTTWIEEEGFEILRKEGLHFMPWHGMPKKIHRNMDQRLCKNNYFYGINLTVLAQKK